MKKIETLCLSGGGIKSIGILGVLKKLEELHENNKIILNIKEICCISAGCVYGLGYILGFTSDEFKHESMIKDFNEFNDFKYYNFLLTYGFDSGRNLISWIEQMMIKKGFDVNCTFKELYDKTSIKYNVLATNLTTCTYTIFNHINTPDVKITKAIRLSISIPLYFSAETYNNDIHVDGAIIDNYPIKLYNNDLTNVLGIKTVNHGENPDDIVQNKTDSIYTFIKNVIYCFLIHKERDTTVSELYKNHTIYLNVNNNSALTLFLNNDEKTELFQNGYEKCNDFFNQL